MKRYLKIKNYIEFFKTFFFLLYIYFKSKDSLSVIGFWGIGDSMIEVSFLQSYRINNKITKIIVYSNSKLSFIFENISFIDQVEIVSQRMYSNFITYSHILLWLIRLMHHRILLVYANPFIVSNTPDLSGFSIIEILELIIFKSNFDPYFNNENLLKMLNEENDYIKLDKSVIINLNSNTLDIQNQKAYLSIAELFHNYGFNVYINGDKLNEFDNQINISSFDLISLLKLAIRVDFIISIRTGLVDLLYNLDIRTVVVYPNSEAGNRLKESYSLKMWDRDNELLELMEDELILIKSIDEIELMFSSFLNKLD
jgi:ADP-heptose:LPS heptosyltransferase